MDALRGLFPAQWKDELLSSEPHPPSNASEVSPAKGGGRNDGIIIIPLQQNLIEQSASFGNYRQGEVSWETLYKFRAGGRHFRGSVDKPGAERPPHILNIDAR